MFFTYVLFSTKDGRLYTGFTKNIKKRLEEHNNGLTRSTMFRGTFKLIYFEGFINEKDARSRERFLKTGFGREFINKQIPNTLKDMRA